MLGISLGEKLSDQSKNTHNIFLKAFCFFSISYSIPHSIVKRVSVKKNVSAKT